MAPVLQQRVRLLPDAEPMVDFLHLDQPVRDDASWDKVMAKNPDVARAMLTAAIEAFADVEWEAEGLHACLLAIGEAQGLKLGKAQAPIRVAVTGRTVGPPLFESLEVLGRDATLDRMRAALTDIA